MLSPLIESLRPRQWTKNLLLFAGLLYSRHLLDASYFLKSAVAFSLFCLMSGALYLVNDLGDIAKDRAHPVKCRRPLASGRLPRNTAVIFSAIAIPACSVSGFYLENSFGWVLVCYSALVLAYSYVLKQVVILDVLIIASGFVLRAIAGAVVIHVNISSWLLICTIFLSLFLVLNKRRHELSILGDHAESHRSNLAEYTPYLLDLLTVTTAACVLMSYALYTTSPGTIEKIGSRGLVLTIPFVIYGIFRYFYLVHKQGLGGSPEEVLYRDKAMTLNIILYVLVTGMVIYLSI